MTTVQERPSPAAMPNRIVDHAITYPESLTMAVSMLQANLPVIHKAGTAKVKTKQGYDYTYSYANLEDIAPVVYPLLAQYGLAFICCPTFRGGQYGLTARLEHVSGQSRHGWFPLPNTGDPQALGSALTYGRRYLLGCLTGVVTGDEDDDGRAAVVGAGRPPAQPAQTGRRRTAPAAPKAEAAPPDTGAPDDIAAEVYGIYHDQIAAAAAPDDLVALARRISTDRDLSGTDQKRLHDEYDVRMKTLTAVS